MNADLAVFFFVLGCLLFGLGWHTRGWSDSQAPKVEIRRIVAPITPANIIGCPVTRERIEEHERTCRARQRSTATKGKT